MADYVAYLKKHPSSIDYFHLLNSKKEEGITPSEATVLLSVTLTTASNALRKMEQVGLVKSKKIGKTRRYWSSNTLYLSEIIGKSIEILKKKGKFFRIDLLRDEIRMELKKLLIGQKKYGFQLMKDAYLKTSLIEFNLDFQVKKRDSTLSTIILFHVDSKESILNTLGRISALSGYRDELGYVMIILLVGARNFAVNPELIRRIVNKLLPDAFLQIFPSYDEAFLMPDFGKSLARNIWFSLFPIIKKRTS